MKKTYTLILSLLLALVAQAQYVSIDSRLALPGNGSVGSRYFDEVDSVVFRAELSDQAAVTLADNISHQPWYDFQRAFIKLDALAGNYYVGSTEPLPATDLTNAMYSLLSVIGYSVALYDALEASESLSAQAKNLAEGEVLIYRAMAYFYAVRMLGDFVIIHNINEVNMAAWANLPKVACADIYEYIIFTLETAIAKLPSTYTIGHMDAYCAKGLLAKVYLTRAGLSGSLNQADLQQASLLANDVINNSSRQLMPNYEDIFRGSNNWSQESLIALHWQVGSWTMQNSIQSDIAMSGFSDLSDSWGGWNGASLDLQEAFGATASDNPDTRDDSDVRRKATYMLAGDEYPYFWRDHKLPRSEGYGFNLLDFFYSDDANYNPNGTYGGPGNNCSGNAGLLVKHLYGNSADHLAEMGTMPTNMASALATHLLRLADIYLIYAEAEVLQGNTTGLPLQRLNTVRQRAGAAPLSTLTWMDIWRERRLELAFEGDRWFDFVRVSFYNRSFCTEQLTQQNRGRYYGLSEVWKHYYRTGVWYLDPNDFGYYDDSNYIPPTSFYLPVPPYVIDILPALVLDVPPTHVDVRTAYHF